MGSIVRVEQESTALTPTLPPGTAKSVDCLAVHNHQFNVWGVDPAAMGGEPINEAFRADRD